MNVLYMTEKQKSVIQRLFRIGKTYHSLAMEAGIQDQPDKFEDLSYEMADRIIKTHRGLLGLRR